MKLDKNGAGALGVAFNPPGPMYDILNLIDDKNMVRNFLLLQIGCHLGNKLWQLIEPISEGNK